VSFTAITLFVGPQRVFIFVVVYLVISQSGNFWIQPRAVRSNLCFELGVLKFWALLPERYLVNTRHN
jgi:predicted PurR-regulated permease PerM